jgi:hypothetical protein
MSVYSGPEIPNDGLVLSLDAGNFRSYPGTGTAWSDLSGNGNSGTLINGPTYDSAYGGSLVFDGVNDYSLVTCNANTVRAYNSTTHFIIKLPTYGGGQRNILSYRLGGGNSLYIGKRAGGIFCYYNTLNSAAFTVGSIPDNSVVHVVVTCDATNNLFSTYINGNLAGSVTRTGWSTSYNTTMVIGGSDLEYMIGNFYSFNHYNRVLTSNEVKQLYNALRGRYGI